MINFDITFNKLARIKVPADEGLPKLKIAILADFASQYITKGLKGAGAAQGLDITVWEADYDAISSQVYNLSSELYSSDFDYIILFYSPFKYYKEYSLSQNQAEFADSKLAMINESLDVIHANTKASVVVANFPEIDDAVFGNYANKVKSSFLFQVRAYNLGLMQAAIEKPGLYVLDLQSLYACKGRDWCFDNKLYIHGDIVYSLDFTALFVQHLVLMIQAQRGIFKKCVILDLDNTLWGGIIGDDGLENIQIGDLGLGKAFTNLQLWLKNLKSRGIILAVSSKNTESIARVPFSKHPGMVLKDDDISVFAINWETKVDNIIFIQSILNIGFDSMVFLDDNPFERNIVKKNIPQITVPDLPEDPAEYLPYLQSLNLFETGSFSAADADRTRQYKEESTRTVFQKSFQNEDDFLKSLGMKGTITRADSFSLPRIAQLTQRSNQFNLRTVRYSEAELVKLAADDKAAVLGITLTDTFGDYGLISAIILRPEDDHTMFIDTWIMSCRVLKRGVERAVLNHIVTFAKANGFSVLKGEYIPTAKNALVKDHYQNLGFQESDEPGVWQLDIYNSNELINFISI